MKKRSFSVLTVMLVCLCAFASIKVLATIQSASSVPALRLKSLFVFIHPDLALQKAALISQKSPAVKPDSSLPPLDKPVPADAADTSGATKKASTDKATPDNKKDTETDSNNHKTAAGSGFIHDDDSANSSIPNDSNEAPEFVNHDDDAGSLGKPKTALTNRVIIHYKNKGVYVGWLTVDYEIMDHDTGRIEKKNYDGSNLMVGQTWEWQLPINAYGNITIHYHNTGRNLGSGTFPAYNKEKYLCVKTSGTWLSTSHSARLADAC